MVTTAIHTIHDRNLRGHSKIGWLDSWHTFSFSGFQDPTRIIVNKLSFKAVSQ